MNDRTHGAKTRRYEASDPNGRSGFAELPGAADGIGGEEFDPRRPLRSFLSVAARVLLAPRGFFSGLEPHGPAAYALFFALSCSVVSYALAGTAGRALAAVLVGPGVASGGTGLPGFLIGVPLSLVDLLVSAVVVHALARAFLTRELGLGATFRVACYASATELVAWLPIVGPMTVFYWIFLMVLGLISLNASAVALAEEGEIA